ncbi:MAG: polysaccharide deacetylase family protein [Bacteroidota bacterium]
MITVDTETFLVHGQLVPFGMNIYGRIDGAEYGVRRIMEICERHKVRATFFVDVYMYHRYGVDKVRELCETLIERGHDVELHAHASWIPDRPHGFVSAYSLDQQIDIIADGRKLIGNWTGAAPIAFRAGSYGVNLDTIRALEVNGFAIDSSYFAFHRNCEMSRQLNNRYVNKRFKIGSIVEIPVSTYWLVHNRWMKKNSKLDVNACSAAEFRNVLPKFIHAEAGMVVLFLHSFSFVRWRKGFSGVEPDFGAMRRFEQALEFVGRCGSVDFLTMREAVPLARCGNERERDFVPSVNVLKLFGRVMQRLV